MKLDETRQAHTNTKHTTQHKTHKAAMVGCAAHQPLLFAPLQWDGGYTNRNCRTDTEMVPTEEIKNIGNEKKNLQVHIAPPLITGLFFSFRRIPEKEALVESLGDHYYYRTIMMMMMTRGSCMSSRP
mmetsp:Transcript_1683/g.4425  ORF Transcript_1683/g.4425 Transcript_1683/m.4425 type:complete len:127 (+) Transcript_1683:420-800(+)